MTGTRPASPHVQRRQGPPGGDVAAGAERLAFAAQDRNARLSRLVDRTSRIGKRVDHGLIERVELVAALQRQSRQRAIEYELDERSHCTASMAGRSCSLMGPGWNKFASIAFSCGATRSGNSDCASTSRSRLTPGAISRTVSPADSSRITHRSVTYTISCPC